MQRTGFAQTQKGIAYALAVEQSGGSLSEFLGKPELVQIWELELAQALEQDRREFQVELFEALAKAIAG